MTGGIHFTRIFYAVAAIGLAVIAILVAPLFFRPSFEVMNHSSGTVSVTAAWRQHEKDLGSLPPGTSLTFSVDDEAAMVFRADHKNGTITESEPVYFTRGVTVMAVLNDRRWHVFYAHDKIE